MPPKQDERQAIQSENEHKFFTMMLNMADDELDPFQYRLLGHYIRWAGHGGIHQEGIRQTAKVCRMSVNTVRKTREQLAQMGYIELEIPSKEEAKKGVPTRIKVIDRWAENILRYSKPISNQIQGVSNMTQDKPQTCAKSDTPPVSNPTHYEEHGEEQILEEQNQKDISPQGEQPKPTAFEPFIEELFPDDEPTPKLTNHQVLVGAVMLAFGAGGGFAATLAKQLTGTADKGKRQEWNIKPGMAPVEIVAFASWYATTYEGKPPTTAETLYERVEEFRGIQEVNPEAWEMYLFRAKHALSRYFQQRQPKPEPEEEDMESADDLYEKIAELSEGWE